MRVMPLQYWVPLGSLGERSEDNWGIRPVGRALIKGVEPLAKTPGVGDKSRWETSLREKNSLLKPWVRINITRFYTRTELRRSDSS